MTRRIRLFAFALLAASVAAGPAAAQMAYGKAPRSNKEPDLPVDADGKTAVRVDQKLGAKVPFDLRFLDHDGKEVTLGECVGGKPTILVLAYYSCPKLCTEVLNGLTQEMKKLARVGLTAGRDFHVVTVGINPKENYTFARIKREAYLNEYDKRNPAEPGWWFLTASHGQGTDLLAAEDTVRTLADAIGFRYVPDNNKAYQQAAEAADEQQRRVKRETAIRKTKEYVHPSTVTVLTPDGTVSQYFHGMPRIGGGDVEDGYTAEDLRQALAAANGGKVGTLLSRAMVNCFAYDDLTGHYQPVMRSLTLLAAPFPLLVGAIVWTAWRRSRREKAILPRTAGEPPGPSVN